MIKQEKLEQMVGLKGDEPDTVVLRVVPRGDDPALPCGRDALGRPLKEGDAVVCLCCGATGKARTLTDHEKKWAERYDYQGSSWVKADRWLAKVLEPLPEPPEGSE